MKMKAIIEMMYLQGKKTPNMKTLVENPPKHENTGRNIEQFYSQKESTLLTS